jgi:hypothetical protein
VACHVTWRGAFRQHAAFDKTPASEGLESCQCSLCERKLFE